MTAVGEAVHRRVAAGSFIGLGLELGGKDPAYVRPDVDLSHAVPSLVDGAFFNAGQSCCAVERVYVDRRIYAPFLDALAEVGVEDLALPATPARVLSSIW